MSAFDTTTGLSEQEEVRVREAVLEGMDEDVDVLAIDRKHTFKTASLTGEGPVIQEEWRKSTHIPTDAGIGVLEALADYYGYRLEPK